MELAALACLLPGGLCSWQSPGRLEKNRTGLLYTAATAKPDQAEPANIANKKN
jgi:hypothetical protein